MPTQNKWGTNMKYTTHNIREDEAVTVDATWEPPSGDGWNEPREDGRWIIEGDDTLTAAELIAIAEELSERIYNDD